MVSPSISSKTPGVTGYPSQVAVRAGCVTVKHTCKQGSPIQGLSTTPIPDTQESEGNYRGGGGHICQQVYISCDLYASVKTL